MTPTTFVQSGDISLAVYTWGQPAAGKPAVLLVHGYPDSASVWEACAVNLSKDHFVIAYDVRGAGQSGVPQRLADFDMEHLVEDMAAVLDAVSPVMPVHVVGHDWGSIQSWECASSERLKGRLLSYTSASGPCLDHVGHWIRSRMKAPSLANLKALARQAAHSWYIGMFHMPVLGPGAWKIGLDRQWPKILEKLEGVGGHRNPTQRGDGAVGVNLYRANILKRVLKPNIRRVDIPVQLIVALRDPFMINEIFEDLPRWVPQLWRRDIDSGHWLQVSHPDWMAQSVREFIQMLEGAEPVRDLQRITDAVAA